MAKQSVKWLRLLSVLICAAAVIGSGLKSLGMLPQSVAQIEHWLGGDKPLHLLVAFSCSFAVLSVSALALRPLRQLPWLLLLAFSADEGLQLFSPHRQFSWGDLLANVLGLALALLVIKALQRWLKRQQQQEHLDEVC